MKRSKVKKVIAVLLCFNLLFGVPNLVLGAIAEKTNSYPIVMVHGLLGWGNDELFGVNYWGGKHSLREELTERGHEVYTPTIGSISSNWDRACELYAYLKGGIVDYGQAHSQKYGHDRYGRIYPGEYKNIDNVHKIHLVGHSMGGETSRVMVQLLEQGSKEEIAATKQGTLSPLFTGGRHYVHSVTTIGTPHDGSPEAYMPTGMEPLTHQLFALMAVQGGYANSDNPCFDFKLDQWGLKKQPEESYVDYYIRVMNSNIWKETKDLSIWDLTPEGARDLNQWVNAESDVYYFSIACKDTHKDLFTGFQEPNVNMSPIFRKSSYFIGSYTKNKPGEVVIDKTWWENDGVVSVISAKCPHVGSMDKMVNYNGTAKKGVWNYLGLINNIDHLEVVQMVTNSKTLKPKYYELANMLQSIP